MKVARELASMLLLGRGRAHTLEQFRAQAANRPCLAVPSSAASTVPTWPLLPLPPSLRLQIRPLWRHYYNNTQVGPLMGGGSASVGVGGWCWRKAR